MTTISTTNNNAIASGASSSTSGLSGAVQSAADISQQFLTLLVSQLKNQDPLNPVDNAQMTTQMAQISTVSGIQTLNSTVAGLNTNFLQMQAVQGAALVGRTVTLPGNLISVANGVASGSFTVSGAADTVTVNVLNAAGVKVDSLSLGAETAGQHDFTWPNGSSASQTDGYTFQVSASSKGSAVGSTALMRDTVTAINTSGSGMTLELTRSGDVPYSAITAIN